MKKSILIISALAMCLIVNAQVLGEVTIEPAAAPVQVEQTFFQKVGAWFTNWWHRNDPKVETSMGQLVLIQGSDNTILAPNGEYKQYLWASVSPNKQLICYYVSGLGCYVCDLKGESVIYIARDLRAAKWLTDYVLVGMEDYDDGEVVIASSIVAYNLRGEKQVLTPEYMMAFDPIVEDGVIRFSTDKDEYYTIKF